MRIVCKSEKVALAIEDPRVMKPQDALVRKKLGNAKLHWAHHGMKPRFVKEGIFLPFHDTWSGGWRWRSLWEFDKQERDALIHKFKIRVAFGGHQKP